jgi:hypothetical protein
MKCFNHFQNIYVNSYAWISIFIDVRFVTLIIQMSKFYYNIFIEMEKLDIDIKFKN